MGSGNTKLNLVHKAVIEGDVSKYGSGPGYWDWRYSQEGNHQFDWLQRYGHPTEDSPMRKVIREFAKLEDYILVVGAGTSRMSEEMNADGYLTILNTDVSGVAVRLMTERYKERFGRWMYRVHPGCKRLWARREPEMGGEVDSRLFEALAKMGIATMTEWLLELDMTALSPLFRERTIHSPRDVLVFEPDQMSQLLEDMDEFCEQLEEEEEKKQAEILAAAQGKLKPGSGALVPEPKSPKSPGSVGSDPSDPFGLLESTQQKRPAGGGGQLDGEGRTRAMRFQEEVAKLRQALGYNVERGGIGRTFLAKEHFVVVERRHTGAQTHLRLETGGWVTAKHPGTFEALTELVKQLPGGFPPSSVMLNPDEETNKSQLFISALDYRQMNALSLSLKDDTFDCVLCKATLDSMLTRGEQGRDDACTLLKEVYRVLKPTGKFICVSHGGAHPDLVNRLELFKEDLGTFRWGIESRMLPKPEQPGQFHCAYVCTPQPVTIGEIWDVEEAQSAVVS